MKNIYLNGLNRTGRSYGAIIILDSFFYKQAAPTEQNNFIQSNQIAIEKQSQKKERNCVPFVLMDPRFREDVYLMQPSYLLPGSFLDTKGI